MSEFKGTPGPWFYAYGSTWTTPDGPDDGGIKIGGADRNEDRTMPTERDANERLRAAAPELLRALCDLDEWLATEFPQRALGRKQESIRIELLRKARAAIAKATGN